MTPPPPRVIDTPYLSVRELMQYLRLTSPSSVYYLINEQRLPSLRRGGPPLVRSPRNRCLAARDRCDQPGARAETDGLMPPYETDLFWIVVFWLTMAVGTVSCVAAAIVLAIDFVRARDPEPRSSAIRHRLRALPKHPPQ